jgi:hypothetical protein
MCAALRHAWPLLLLLQHQLPLPRIVTNPTIALTLLVAAMHHHSLQQQQQQLAIFHTSVRQHYSHHHRIPQPTLQNNNSSSKKMANPEELCPTLVIIPAYGQSTECTLVKYSEIYQ